MISDKTIDKISNIFLIAMIAVVIIVVSVLIYRFAFSEKLTLIKSEWECIETRDQVRLMPSANTLIPIHDKECILYRRVE